MLRCFAPLGRVAGGVWIMPEKWYTMRGMFGTILRRAAMIFLCAIITVPVSAKGICTQSELDSVTEMSRLQERLFNPVQLTWIKRLLYLQPLYNETPIQRAQIKLAMGYAAKKINVAFGVKIVDLVRDDVIAENLAIVVPIKYAPSGVLAYEYPDIDWNTKMAYTTQDAIILVADKIESGAETYETDSWKMMQFAIMREVSRKIGLQDWFEYGDKEDVCLMGEVGENVTLRSCIPLDFCAAEKEIVKALE